MDLKEPNWKEPLVSYHPLHQRFTWSGNRNHRCTGQKATPKKQISYTIDLTRQYHNLFQKEESGQSQIYLWDGNVAGVYNTAGNTAMKWEYYLQDELGSPIRLLDEEGILTESYGYDEFGSDLYGNQGQVQPFGYTGYQHDSVAGTYFAQAREYQPEVGRFIGQDVEKGYKNLPISLNLYSYCYSSPLKFVDYKGEDARQILEYGMTAAGTVAMLDSPAPGLMDLIALAIVGGTILVAGGVVAYDYAKSKKKEKEIAVSDVKTSSAATIIYRYGSGNATNLTPREVDITGLSYSLTPPIGGVKYTMTTIEAVNSTGVLMAIIDGPNHVSVCPVNPLEMQPWIESRPTAKDYPYYLTKILASISIKSSGGVCDVY